MNRERHAQARHMVTLFLLALAAILVALLLANSVRSAFFESVLPL